MTTDTNKDKAFLFKYDIECISINYIRTDEQNRTTKKRIHFSPVLCLSTHSSHKWSHRFDTMPHARTLWKIKMPSRIACPINLSMCMFCSVIKVDIPRRRCVFVHVKIVLANSLALISFAFNPSILSMKLVCYFATSKSVSFCTFLSRFLRLVNWKWRFIFCKMPANLQILVRYCSSVYSYSIS